MTGGGRIENRNFDPVFHNIEHRRVEIPGVVRHRLAGFQINRHAVTLLHTPDTALQKRDIVVRARNVVTTAKIQPFHARQKRSEAFFHSVQRRFKRVGVLLAKRMEMKPRDTRKVRAGKLRRRYAKPANPAHTGRKSRALPAWNIRD